MNSKRTKLGAIIGSHVRIGVNTSIMPGIKIGTNSMIGAGLRIDRDIPDGVCRRRRIYDYYEKYTEH